MAHNIELDRCVRGGGCAANKKFAFHAYAPIAQNGAAVHISGVPGREVRYDMNGLICSGPTSQCPHLLRTYFIAKCPNDTANCNQAAFLQVRAEIAQDNSLDLAPNLKGYRAPVLPKDPNLFESKTFVTEIIASVQQECGFGSFMTGVDEKGYITCKCDTGYTQVGFDQLTGKPNCLADKIYCPANTFFNGMKNGKQVCLPIQILYSCSWINVADGSPMNCGNGGKSRLRAVSGQDQCFVEVNQAAREGYVRCPNIRAYCCTQVFQ
jgi:hypothetical protein